MKKLQKKLHLLHNDVVYIGLVLETLQDLQKELAAFNISHRKQNKQDSSYVTLSYNSRHIRLIDDLFYYTIKDLFKGYEQLLQKTEELLFLVRNK